MPEVFLAIFISISLRFLSEIKLFLLLAHSFMYTRYL